jgi:hypothetical protein
MAQVVRQIAVHLSLAILFVTLVASCVTTGDSKLTTGAVGKIVDGETTKGEIEGLLGKPEQIINLDKESLENYVKRVSAGEPPEINLPEDQYEVLTYSRWNQAAVLVLFPSYEKATACILIINSDGICVKKLYTEESRVAY